jgi:hypothetical protein
LSPDFSRNNYGVQGTRSFKGSWSLVPPAWLGAVFLKRGLPQKTAKRLSSAASSLYYNALAIAAAANLPRSPDAHCGTTPPSALPSFEQHHGRQVSLDFIPRATPVHLIRTIPSIQDEPGPTGAESQFTAHSHSEATARQSFSKLSPWPRHPSP